MFSGLFLYICIVCFCAAGVFCLYETFTHEWKNEGFNRSNAWYWTTDNMNDVVQFFCLVCNVYNIVCLMSTVLLHKNILSLCMISLISSCGQCPLLCVYKFLKKTQHCWCPVSCFQTFSYEIPARVEKIYQIKTVHKGNEIFFIKRVKEASGS